MKPSKAAFPSINSVTSGDAGCIDRGWVALDDLRYHPIGIWRIPVSLNFKKGSEFPLIEHLPFDERMKRTKELLGPTFMEVVRLTGTRCVDVLYAPGGVGAEIVPMGVLEVQAPEEIVQEIIGMIKYVLDLENVYTYKDANSPDGIFALDIVQLKGWELADTGFVGCFVRELYKAVPEIGSDFLRIKVDGHPGIRVLNTIRIWKPEDFQVMHSAVQDLSVQQGIRTALDRLLVVDPRCLNKHGCF